MTPHSGSSVVPDILAVRTNVSHRNCRMYGLPKVRALQPKYCNYYQSLKVKTNRLQNKTKTETKTEMKN